MHLDWRRGPDRPYTQLFSGIWGGGNTAHIGPGTTYLGIAGDSKQWGVPKGIRVPDFLTCQLRGRGGSWQTPVFQPGSRVEHLAYWGDYQHVPCDVIVTEVAYEAKECVELFLKSNPYGYGGKDYDARFRVPPGFSNSTPDTFPNDAVQAVHIPDNTTAILYLGGNRSEGSLQLEPGFHVLSDYGSAWHCTLSSIDVKIDGWKMLAVEVDPSKDVEWIESNEPRIFNAIASNTSESPLTVSHTFSEQVTEQETYGWEAGGSLTASSEVSAEADAGVVKVGVKAGLSLTLHAGVHGDNSHGVANTIEDSASIELHPGQAARMTMKAENGLANIPLVRRYRNLRTGHEVVQRGVCVRGRFARTETSASPI